ncbi:MAG: hypothetical protein AAGD14_12675 [Planctomycetota bacterium]
MNDSSSSSRMKDSRRHDRVSRDQPVTITLNARSVLTVVALLCGLGGGATGVVSFARSDDVEQLEDQFDEQNEKLMAIDTSLKLLKQSQDRDRRDTTMAIEQLRQEINTPREPR